MTYTWIIEETDDCGDVVNTSEGTLTEVFDIAENLVDGFKIGLCRTDEKTYMQERQWAYVENGKLPQRFDLGAVVPKKFHAELSAAMRCNN